MAAGRSKPLTPEEESWLRIAERVVRPARPRADAVRATLVDHGGDALHPAEAWEALVARGLVAEAWATRGPEDVARIDGPAGLASIVAVAGDPAGVALVEGLALELVARLAPWVDVHPTRVVWRTVPFGAAAFPTPTSFASSPAFRAIEALYGGVGWGPKEDAALRRSVERAFRAVSGRPSGTVVDAKPPLRADDPPWYARFWDRSGAGQQCIYHVVNRALWAQCVAQGARPPSGRGPRRAWDDMLDPAEVLLEVWRAGYVVGDVTEGEVVLWAPEPAS